MNFSVEPIGIIHTCFPEKFGIPRQPLLAPAAKGVLRLNVPYNHPDCVAGLESVSHLWLSFIFHQHLESQWKPKVRPPRLGGNQKMGVFATRSSFRPNHLGLSVVKLEKIVHDANGIVLHLSGIDLLDGTPVVDIKPYVPYADAISEASNPFADTAPVLLPVVFSETANDFCESYQAKHSFNIGELIVQVLQQNPRPAYHNHQADRVYGMALMDCNIRWSYQLNESTEGGCAKEIICVSSIGFSS